MQVPSTLWPGKSPSSSLPHLAQSPLRGGTAPNGQLLMQARLHCSENTQGDKGTTPASRLGLDWKASIAEGLLPQKPVTQLLSPKIIQGQTQREAFLHTFKNKNANFGKGLGENHTSKNSSAQDALLFPITSLQLVAMRTEDKTQVHNGPET